MCSFFIPPPSFGMVEAGIYRCTLPNPLSQVLPYFLPAAFGLNVPLSPSLPTCCRLVQQALAREQYSILQKTPLLIFC